MINRRLLLSIAAGWAAWPLAPRPARAVPRPPTLRRLRLVNAHTGETFTGAYRDGNGPIPEAIEDLCVFLRDFHCGAKTEMDVGVIDFLADVLDAVGETKATILSAYRTPETNAMLARTTFGVAEHSQHMYGRALDFCLGAKLGEAMQAARAMRRGGVGWYPHSGFIHIDIGPGAQLGSRRGRSRQLVAVRRQGRAGAVRRRAPPAERGRAPVLAAPARPRRVHRPPALAPVRRKPRARRRTFARCVGLGLRCRRRHPIPFAMAMFSPAPRLVAVLGPTNTGKTHLAIERMLGHKSGMIGFPLRLLARENYDRIVRLKGARAVALITGEEKILPPNPSYFVCTVESMPLDRPVDFLAVDEIQLCADPERGHVFTARLLEARGLAETMFLGADTIKPLMRRLVPEIEHISRPRFSTLSYTGHKKVTRLPPRSAVVAFAVADVFSLAELIRRQRGGTAVVLGALSPRARNAQVGMFQAGEVDYLVATDAIGMGLNMDLDHVAFARTAKFDGRGPRRLTAAEIAQIAGRAGRHMSDGTFGTTAEQGPLGPEIVEAVETHRFDPLTRLNWRNTRLRFGSVDALLKSLDERPAIPGLVQAREADDHRALQALARNREVAALARHRGAVRLLWEVCQIPDFRKVMSETHTRLLAHIFGHLAGPEERLPTAWIAAQIANFDRVDGDIDTLMARIAHVRTWTYITHRGDWVEGATAWQERARGIEDRLSDALARPDHPALRRSPLSLSGAAAGLRGRALGRRFGGRRGAGRGRLCRPARRSALSPGRDRRGRDADAERRRQPRAAQRGGRAGATPCEPMRTRPSRSTPPVSCAGRAARSAGSSPASGC